jgi:hypothetical protein
MQPAVKNNLETFPIEIRIKLNTIFQYITNVFQRQSEKERKDRNKMGKERITNLTCAGWKKVGDTPTEKQKSR